MEERLQDTLNVEELSDGRFLAEMNKLLATNKISQAEAISELGQKGIKLNDLVVNDPRARALAHFGTIRSIVNEPQIDDTCYRQIEAFLTSVVDFLKAEQEFSKLLLLELYEHGEKVVSQVDENGTPLFSAHTDSGDLVDLCPLCGQTFHGNLKEHITDELENLRKLKETRDELERRRENLLEMLPQKGMFSLSFDQLGDKFSIYDEKLTLSNVQLASSRAEKYIQELRSYLTRRVDRQTHDSIEDIEVVFDKFKDGIKVFKELRGQLHEAIRNGEIELGKDNDAREKLVKDNTNFGLALNLWSEFGELSLAYGNLRETRDGFENIVDDYIQSSIANVQQRFDTISSDVEKFFETLEQDTDGLQGATLKLLADEDRAVELQINFHGEAIYPAYRYLSESQLNSFGLAVFLASAKYFNSGFKFIILDDIINSFDGYKRPRIIELLKAEFSDHQILLFTHDNVWSARLFEAFPSSIKKRFIRWEINHGPIDVDGFAPLEEIQQHLDNDKPVEAGSLMGPFLERQFQELGEKFEVMIKYNRLNEYSLDPLLDRFRVRVREKLGKAHSLVNAVQNLYDETGFRNLCAHWKNPAIQLTREEMKAVVDKWIEIERLAKCQQSDCLKWLEYDSSISGFVCPCGNTSLEKEKS